jgi:hypothetical protein
MKQIYFFENHVNESSVERENLFLNLIHFREFSSFKTMFQDELNNLPIDSYKFPGILSRVYKIIN